MKRFKELLAVVFLIISILMMVAGLALDILAWMGVVAKGEPVLVLHLSTWAIITAGFGNVIISIVNKEQ